MFECLVVVTSKLCFGRLGIRRLLIENIEHSPKFEAKVRVPLPCELPLKYPSYTLPRKSIIGLRHDVMQLKMVNFFVSYFDFRLSNAPQEPIRN